MVKLLRGGVAHNDAAAFVVLDDDLALQRKVSNPDKDGYIKLAQALTETSEWTPTCSPWIHVCPYTCATR